MAKQLEKAGAHILGIKDMAGVLPAARGRDAGQGAARRRSACRSTSTRTTPAASRRASVLAAIEAGVDAVDGALDSMSGLTSQPNLGSIVAALRYGTDATRASSIATACTRCRTTGKRAPRLRAVRGRHPLRHLRRLRHEMPGGQYTNLREQARSLGLDDTRWPEVPQAYADVNELFGDIVKVTPTSKVVGDMALFMVTNDLTRRGRARPGEGGRLPRVGRVAVPRRNGQPPDGFPPALQKKVLKGAAAARRRGRASDLPPVDLERRARRAQAEDAARR